MRFIRVFSPGRIILVATVLVAAYLAVSAGNNLLHSYHLVSDESELRSEVEGLRMQQEELQQIRDYLRTDEYVEYMARRTFGLVKRGENLVIVDAPKPEPTVDPDNDAERWWEELFGR